MKTIIEILKNYKFNKKTFFLYIIIWSISEIFYLWIPKFVSKIISIIEKKELLSELYLWIWFFAILILFAKITWILTEYFWHKLRLNTYSDKMQYYRKKLFKKNYKDIINEWTWKLITRFSDWAFAEADIFAWIIQIIISAIFRWILVIIILAFIIPKLIIAVLISIVILFILNYYVRLYARKYIKREQELREQDGRLKARLIMENLIIRIFSKQDQELSKSKKILEEIPKNWIKADIANHIFYSFIELLLRLLEIWTFIILGTIIIKWWYSISYLIMVTTYIWFLWWPLDKALSNLNRINRQWEKYKKLNTFINQPIDIKDGTKKYNYKKWKIDFINLDFSYEKWKNIFKNLNIELLEWKKNALIWHSWWGKSTIIKILLRLYDYSKGEIIIDWQNLRNLKIDTLYQHIWYLPQEPAIFDGTIRENLEYAFLKNNKKTQDDIIWKALKDAQIDSMVKKLKKWLDTEVWEKWIKLSGWEKQRLAIARIFLKNPQIIILDEPTSALDSISESKITKTLNKLLNWKTSIIIAHRLQTVINSDKIIIIENGEIKAEWKHKDLINSSKIYKKLVDLQNWRIEE